MSRTAVMPEKWRLRLLIVAIFLGFLAITILEAMLPRATAAWVLYIPLISLTALGRRPIIPLFFAASCSVWVVLDLIWIESWPISAVMVIRRGIGIISFFAVALIVRYAVIVEKKIRISKIKLEKSAADLAIEKLKLERSNRELDQFAAVAAHDLRAPIATVFSWTNLLDRLVQNPRSAEVNEALTFIQSSAERACQLIDDILQMARLNGASGSKENVDLTQLLSEVVADLREDISRSSATFEIPPLPTVYANRNHLGSVFRNLIRNAIVYMHKNRPPVISIGYRDINDKYEFFVRDNGIGIAPQHQESIFNLFRRLNNDPEKPGTGIGLAFCKKVIELNGGKIWVDSVPEIGSTFYFTYTKESGEG